MAARRRKPAQAERTDAPHAGGARPIWSGTISFGLVAVPVNLFPAVRPADTKLRLLAPDGTPVERRFVCPEHGKDVEYRDLVRGYEVEEGRHVPLTDDELEAIAPRKSRDIDLRRFVPRTELDPFLFERAYVLTPGGDSTKAYRLLAEVMEAEGKAGIATFVMRTKEYLVAILAHAGILWAETLRLAGEVRTPRAVGLAAPPHADAKGTKQFVDAIRALEQDSVDRDDLVDDRAQRLHAIAEKRARTGHVVAAEPPSAEAEPAASEEAPDLFESIRASLARVRARTNGRHAPRRPRLKASAPPAEGSRAASGARRRSRAKGRRRTRAGAARSAR